MKSIKELLESIFEFPVRDLDELYAASSSDDRMICMDMIIALEGKKWYRSEYYD